MKNCNVKYKSGKNVETIPAKSGKNVKNGYKMYSKIKKEGDYMNEVIEKILSEIKDTLYRLKKDEYGVAVAIESLAYVKMISSPCKYCIGEKYNSKKCNALSRPVGRCYDGIDKYLRKKCEHADDSCRQEKLGCEGCFYNKGGANDGK